MLSLLTTVATALEKKIEPVITDYDLSRLIHKIYNEINAAEKSVSKDIQISKNIFNSILTTLTELNIIRRNKDFTGGAVFSIVKNNSEDIHAIICSVDPFVYISHLSAMNLYGMSDKVTKTIYITEPTFSMWSEFANEKMIRDNITLQNAPKLHKISYDKVNNYKIVKLVDKNYGEFTTLKNSNVKISNLGRTFLDMIRKPEYSGTLQHVLAIYKEFGAQYSDLIIDQINKYGSAIEKVRAGFILEEYCGVKNPIIDSWIRFCQRGGSRKLDPTKGYKANFSERWCLSINL
jgi:predicted transcriptional regulator of viral defense system